MLTQRVWRTVGLVAVACCGILAWYGDDTLRSGASPLYLFVYFGLFTLSLLVAIYVVLLDIRHIRLQYLAGQQEIFRNTLGSEEFRRELRKKQAEKPPAREE